ncbi:unnamed protein product, partial [Didymodactylos carnosus]
NYSVSILTNISALSTDLVVDAVFDFFGALKNTSVQNAVTVKQVDASILDTVIDKINVSITRSTPEAYLLSTNPQSNNSLLVGASFYASVGGKSITNQDNVIPQITNISAAAVISDELTLENLAFLKILIIDQPDNLRLYDTNETMLSSSVISMGTEPQVDNITVALYFTITFNNDIIDPRDLSKLQCSFWENATRTWDNTGCGTPTPMANITPSQLVYRCECNHLTTFALIWLPLTETSRKNIMYVQLSDLLLKLF